MTECTTKKINFQDLDNKKVIASFDGGNISSDSGGLLLRKFILLMSLQNVLLIIGMKVISNIH